MNFVSIPKNGSSWQEPLIYSFETEGAIPTDVVVEICDVGASSMLATKSLYGVASGEIDIAPYLRSLCDQHIKLADANSVTNTQMARTISVKINGSESESRLFMPRSIDITKPRILTRFSADSSFAIGDVIAFSVFVPSNLIVVANIVYTSNRQQVHLQFAASNSIVDVVIRTHNLRQNVEFIDLDIHCGGTVVKSLRLSAIEPHPRRRQLLWRNQWGGVESYVFPQSITLARAVDAETLKFASRDVVMLSGAEQRSRLCSAFETEQELERISEIVLSPYVCSAVEGELCEVKLDNRTIEYDAHGNLRQIVLDVTSKWEGGGLW